MCGFARAEANEAGLLMSSEDRITHVVETDRQGKNRKNSRSDD
jgi:hypothetical protein